MTMITVQNIVASVDLKNKLDLETIAMTFENTEYEPEQFPGLVYRIENPKTVILLFSSGKANCVGCNSLEDVKTSVRLLTGSLNDAGIQVVKKPVIKVQNIVATYDLGSKLDLRAVMISRGLERVEYEPEVFPGLVYRLTEPKAVILLFSSGKMVLTGMKRVQEISIAATVVEDELRKSGLISSRRKEERYSKVP